VGTDLHAFDTLSDAVAMLSGAGTAPAATPERRIAVPLSHLHQA